MTTLTQPLKDEHKELYPHVDQIRLAAEKIGIAPEAEIRAAVEHAFDFLAYHLKPHAEAEDAALYPVVQKVLGSPLATRTMSRDHVEVGSYIAELAGLREELNRGSLSEAKIIDLRRVLFGVYGLVKVHFAKEEEIYLPILDGALTPETAREMFEAMEEAAGEAKRAARNQPVGA